MEKKSNDDEEQIRALVSIWISATKAGDVETVLDLMADDAVFLLPGQAPMYKSEFAAAARARASQATPAIEAKTQIQEIKVAGDWAFMWAWLDVVATPADGAPAVERAGHTLTVLHKEAGGRWVLARDANLLTPVKPPGG